MKLRATLPPAIIFLLALAVLLNYIDRGNLATAAPLLSQELGMMGWGLVLRRIEPLDWRRSLSERLSARASERR